ncbi:MAG: hypothetical protein ACTSPB_02330 [Candidatus Thorarchaeota archaeon]
MNEEKLTQIFYKTTKGTRFSSDTFRRLELDKHFNHPNAIGAFFTNLKNNGLLKRVGETKSVIPTNKGRRIPVYVWSRKATRKFTEIKKLDELFAG